MIPRVGPVVMICVLSTFLGACSVLDGSADKERASLTEDVQSLQDSIASIRANYLRKDEVEIFNLEEGGETSVEHDSNQAWTPLVFQECKHSLFNVEMELNLDAGTSFVIIEFLAFGEDPNNLAETSWPKVPTGEMAFRIPNGSIGTVPTSIWMQTLGMSVYARLIDDEGEDLTIVPPDSATAFIRQAGCIEPGFVLEPEE